jgi:hypothetical protein
MAWQPGSFEGQQAVHKEIQELGIPIETTIQHNVTKMFISGIPTTTS